MDRRLVVVQAVAGKSSISSQFLRGDNAVKIRHMQADELENVIQLWRATCADTYAFLTVTHTEEGDRNFFTNHVAPKNTIWVVAEDDQLLGFLAIDNSYVDRLYIHPAQQRKGLGAALIDHAKFLSPAGVELHTHVKNVNACAFYEKHGFVAVNYGISAPPESEPDVEYHWRPHNVLDTKP